MMYMFNIYTNVWKILVAARASGQRNCAFLENCFLYYGALEHSEREWS